jgi:hypothetical protein
MATMAHGAEGTTSIADGPYADWSNDDALIPGERQLTLNSIAARSGLEAELKPPSGTRQLGRQRLQRRRRVVILPYSRTSWSPAASASATAIRVLVHHICGRFI